MAVAALDPILHAIETLWMPGEVYELRVLHTRRGTVSGYFDDPRLFARSAAEWDGKAPAVYMTLNPVNPVLHARAHNRCHEWSRSTTHDHEIKRRCWLPFDFDPVRPADISSTEFEHRMALERVAACARWLVDQGFSRSSLLLADSGNGGHLLARIDLPNDDASTALVRRCIEAVSLRFSDDAVAVDSSIYNAARIWKVYGTHTCKGDSVADRPHRLARILRGG